MVRVGDIDCVSCSNRVPTKNKEINPFEEWEKKRFKLSYLRTWGCFVKVNVQFPKKRQLEQKP
jgi:hypothetical protein